MNPIPERPPAQRLYDELRLLREQVHREGEVTFSRWRPYIYRRSFLLSARNLAFYLALRQRDLRELQRQLSLWGLSSLGRSESRVLSNLDAVIATLGRLCALDDAPPHPRPRRLLRGERLLRRHTNSVFGPPQPRHSVRIMVTLPSEAADDPAFIRDLAARGTDCIRINTSHDSPAAWEKMIAHVRSAEAEVGRSIRVLMDLGGPKPRTADVLAPKKARLKTGDVLLLTRGHPDATVEITFQARCVLPEVLDQLALNDRVFLDDGQVGMRVEALLPGGAVLRVIHASEKGYKLKDEKGLNFPDTELELAPLQPADLAALDFVARHADMVGYSFVQSGEDIALLQRELASRMPDLRRIALIAKIETPRAVRALPEIIVRAAGLQPFGVMIARGDLAVEMGFGRTAEMQEEILWLCEAANVPVIWATQVMESFVRTGTPSRGEMTDAAMSARAECVMLNKGPFVAEAVSMLDALLERMQQHQTKKSPQMRALTSWRDVLDA